MRIDFAARYRQVADLINASAKPLAKSDGVEFERDLGSLILQDTENTEQKAARLAPRESETPLIRQSLKDPLEDIRASFRFPEPEQQMTPLQPASPLEQVPPPLTPAGETVKTPTLLEVKRVELPVDTSVTGVPQLGKSEIKERLVSMANQLGLDPALTQAVVGAESSYNVRAVSTDGHESKGLFQLLDSTGKGVLARLDGDSAKYDPFNPDLNIKLGSNYLRYLHDIFKSPTELPNRMRTYPAADGNSLERFAIAAFNAGEGRVASAQSRSEALGKDPSYYDQVAPLLPRSTRDYVRKVLEGKKAF
jgi:soluble lytic murein transglycosylase-like protein